MLMIAIESDCVDCPAEMGCIYGACPYYRVVRYYCDKCGEEETIYEFDGEQLCADCILERLERVEYYE